MAGAFLCPCSCPWRTRSSSCSRQLWATSAGEKDPRVLSGLGKGCTGTLDTICFGGWACLQANPLLDLRAEACHVGVVHQPTQGCLQTSSQGPCMRCWDRCMGGPFRSCSQGVQGGEGCIQATQTFGDIPIGSCVQESGTRATVCAQLCGRFCGCRWCQSRATWLSLKCHY